jgi:hypothetical protein
MHVIHSQSVLSQVSELLAILLLNFLVLPSFLSAAGCYATHPHQAVTNLATNIFVMRMIDWLMIIND